MQPKPQPVVLAVVSGWEFLALTTGLVPTVTNLMMRLPRQARTVAVCAVSLWLAAHFELREVSRVPPRSDARPG